MIRRIIGWGIILALLGAAFLFARDYLRKHPQDVPWTALDLRQPIGMFTLRKLTALRDDPRQCRTLLARAGTGDRTAPERRDSPQCGYGDGILLGRSGRDVGFAPAGLITSCPVASALAIFESEVLQPAALRHFGAEVVSLDHAGSYSCRRLYGRSEGAFSEHSTANAIDVIGFRLSDGTSVSVLRDWRGSGPKADFLREVRDGGCKVFATVLSPDYNAAHADHLHLDLARRGTVGWSFCR